MGLFLDKHTLYISLAKVSIKKGKSMISYSTPTNLQYTREPYTINRKFNDNVLRNENLCGYNFIQQTYTVTVFCISLQ